MKIAKLLSIALFTAYSSSALALPALQLGPGGTGTWGYVADGDDTWYTVDTNFELSAYANATTADGGNGDFAWDEDPLIDKQQFAYLVAAAAPNTTDNTDVFDISVAGDSGSLSMISSGFGAPPINDSNSLAGHGIFDTYFEVYEFRFDGGIDTIYDTQEDQTGSGQGFAENFDITINSMMTGVTGVHFDLFTVVGDKWFPGKDVADVKAFAPYSHDAQYNVPEPAMSGLLAIGLFGLVIARRKKA